MSKGHYKEQKMLIENFRQWEAKGNRQLLKEMPDFVFTIQMIRIITRVFQTLVRSPAGREAIASIPRYGPQILQQATKADESFSQYFENLVAKIKEENPFFYKLVFYPYILIGYTGDLFIDDAYFLQGAAEMATSEIARVGSEYAKKQATIAQADEKERQRLEKEQEELKRKEQELKAAKKQAAQALPAAEQVRDNLLNDPRTKEIFDMGEPEDVNRIRVSDPSPDPTKQRRRGKTTKFEPDPNKKSSGKMPPGAEPPIRGRDPKNQRRNSKKLPGGFSGFSSFKKKK
tara:strand:+ start:148 stop:1011 length:864 start_codon:yes stop_codon:yes gene_type:complete